MPKHRPVIACQWKGQCEMEVPPPGMMRCLGPRLDQATDQTFHRTPGLFTEKVKRANGEVGSFALDIENQPSEPESHFCEAVPPDD